MQGRPSWILPTTQDFANYNFFPKDENKNVTCECDVFTNTMFTVVSPQD